MTLPPVCDFPPFPMAPTIAIKPDSLSGSRLEHLDGLRGLAATVVVFCHFAWSLFPHAIVAGKAPLHGGWEPAFLNPPLGVLLSGYFAVCLFFLLSGYVLALPLLQKGLPWREIVVASAKRPFRLAGIVLATNFISWLLWRHGLYLNHEVAEVTGSGWLAYYWSSPAPLPGVFAHQLITTPFETATACNPPLWTIKRELLGSFLVYGILLAGRTRLLRWGILAVVSWWFAGNFFQCFIIGVMIADMQCWRGWPQLLARFSPWGSGFLILITVVCGSYPKYAMSYTPGHPDPWWLFSPRLPWLGGGWPMVGALAVFLLALHSPMARYFFTRRPLLFLGKVSYSLYGIHFIIVGSLMSWIFLAVLPVCGYLVSALLAFLTLAAVTLVCAKLLGETVDNFSIYLAKLVGTHVRLLLSWRGTPVSAALEPKT